MAETRQAAGRRRVDLRLVPTVLATWGAALVGTLGPQLWSVLLGVALTVGAVSLMAAHGGKRRSKAGPARTMTATLALACMMGATVAMHCAVAAENRSQGPLAATAESNESVVIHLRVVGAPAALSGSLHQAAGRWAVPASLESFTSKGNIIKESAAILVIGGDEWQEVKPGELLRTTGSFKEARPGQAEAAVLSASTAPVIVGSDYDLQQTAADARDRFRNAASWLPADAAGLMPGMVTGDTSALPEGLQTAMNTTGMTHLTAVSGANCSLVLGGFILVARTCRLPRPLAAVVGATGLAAFVVLVGPDPSVLRAAVMGSVGLGALTAGLRGRSLTFLCLVSTALLQVDPTLSASFGFLLSVLATLGIVLFATRMSSWFPPWIPSWLATGIAVPLSAQVMCGPAIVALQPQFSPYALLANVLAGPLVAPVTIVGTAAVPLASFAPWLAAVPVAIAGLCTGVVAAIAKLFAGMPGSAMPWPEGPVGMVSMVVLSVVSVFATWAVLHPGGVLAATISMHRKIVQALDGAERRFRCGMTVGPFGWRRKQDHGRRGRLELCTKPSGRNHQWPLPKTPGPRTTRQTTSPGVTRHRPP